ncbi:MAG: hypothetical protein JRG68_05555 [Deltaproteobacteria bacterium]|nr:hypothetical protein [Deltaproteobacteria bacterium]
MNNKKKITAAISAVINYIKTEEEVGGAQPILVPASVPEPYASVNLWRTSGRQAQMQMRNLMQLKTFHGLNLR